MIITERIYQSSDKTDGARVFALDILKSFVYRFYSQLKGYDISGRHFVLIQSFILNVEMQVVKVK